MKKGCIFLRFGCASLIACAVLMIASCVPMQRIVIDGAAAERIANFVVLSARDPEAELRGNNAGNMINGGYIVQQNQDIWYLNTMEFDARTRITYLQRAAVQQIGSTSFRNDIRAPLEGILAGFHQGRLVFIDSAQDNLITSMDVETGETTILSPVPADALHLLDGTLYWSEPESGTIRSMPADAQSPAKVLVEHAGKLAAVSGGWLYILPHGAPDSLQKISISDSSLRFTLTDGPYTAVQISGSWLFFIKNRQLWRQSVDGGKAVPACVVQVDQFVVNGTWMAVSNEAGGISVSRTDGTGITRISDDRATGISLLGSWLFYHNLTDEGRLYAIDLEGRLRTAMDGDTLTDGGVKFIQMAPEESTGYERSFKAVVDGYRQTSTYNDTYDGNLSGDVLFVEIPMDDGDYRYHRLVERPEMTPDSVGTVILITYVRTAIGYYTDGDYAYRIDTILTVFERGNPVPKFFSLVEGKPPVEIKHGQGDRTGLPVSWQVRAMEIIKLIGQR